MVLGVKPPPKTKQMKIRGLIQNIKHNSTEANKRVGKTKLLSEVNVPV